MASLVERVSTLERQAAEAAKQQTSSDMVQREQAEELSAVRNSLSAATKRLAAYDATDAHLELARTLLYQTVKNLDNVERDVARLAKAQADTKFLETGVSNANHETAYLRSDMEAVKRSLTELEQAVSKLRRY